MIRGGDVIVASDLDAHWCKCWQRPLHRHGEREEHAANHGKSGVEMPLTCRTSLNATRCGAAPGSALR